MIKQFQFFVFISILCFAFHQSSAQSSTAANDPAFINLRDDYVGEKATIFKTIQHDEVLNIRLETDFDNLIANKYRNDYQEAVLTIKDSDSSSQVFNIKVKPRGRFRRKTCDFPPLKIKFKKSGLEEKGILTSHKSLKLVTHCLDEKDSEQTLLREYHAYRIYNHLTDASFKVQLVKIEYVNTAQDSASEIKYGFIIENTDEMAERIGGEEVEDAYNTSLDSIHKNCSHRVSMFQYMISNLDWRPAMLQNIKIVERADGERVLVPYDFDFSGLVDAPYAKPSFDHKQTNIRQRIYTYKVTDLVELEETISFFKEKRKDILGTISSCPHLNKKSRKEMISYIKQFYRTLDSNMECQNAFVK